MNASQDHPRRSLLDRLCGVDGITINGPSVTRWHPIRRILADLLRWVAFIIAFLALSLVMGWAIKLLAIVGLV